MKFDIIAATVHLCQLKYDDYDDEGSEARTIQRSIHV